MKETQILPHRPLSRQRDGAKHLGLPLCQLDLRIALEQPLYRPCPDHRGRRHRHRHPRRFLGRSGAAPRHRAKPHDAAALACRHGASCQLERQMPSAMKKSKCSKPIRPLTSKISKRSSSAANMARLYQWRSGRRLPPRKKCQPHFQRRNLCRAAALHRQLALGWRALLSASRKRLPKRAHRNRHHVQRPSGVLFQQHAINNEPNVLVIRIQPDEGISLKINCKVPGPSSPIQPVKMDFRYGSYFGMSPP